MGTGSSDLRGLSADQVLTLIGEYFQSRNMTVAQAFQFLDRDNSSSVSWDEFVRGINICLEQCGSHRLTSTDLWPVFKRFDRNGDNRVSLEEFSSQFSTSRTGGQYNSYDHGGAGRMIGFGPPVIAPNVAAERRVDDVICRIGQAIVRTGFASRQLFEKVDLDHSGRLSWTELERVILSFQPDLSMTERQGVFQRFDRDNSGEVDINEFCSVIDRCNAPALVNVESMIVRLGDKFRAEGRSVSDLFHVFDRNYDGFLTREEWYRAMKTFEAPSNPISNEEIEAVFCRFDINGDGYLAIQEVDTFFKDCIGRSVGRDAYNPQVTPAYGALPVYVPPPVEQPWETEVLETVRSCLGVGRSGMTITEVFRRLDIDHGGTMEIVEFNRMVSAYRPDLTSQHMDSLFRKVNTSGSGRITLSEFVRRFG